MATAPIPNAHPLDPRRLPLRVADIMIRDVVTVSMDTTLGEAIETCAERRLRHLPVVDERKRLVGVVTDRDLRYYGSPRLGTLSENNADRETLQRRIHIIMMRAVVVANSEMNISEAVHLMLRNRVGCLPIVDGDRRVVGMVSTSDFLKLLARLAT